MALSSVAFSAASASDSKARRRRVQFAHEGEMLEAAADLISRALPKASRLLSSAPHRRCNTVLFLQLQMDGGSYRFP